MRDGRWGMIDDGERWERVGYERGDMGNGEEITSQLTYGEVN